VSKVSDGTALGGVETAAGGWRGPQARTSPSTSWRTWSWKIWV